MHPYTAMRRQIAENRTILALLALGLMLRLAWIAYQTDVFQGDECEYLRLAGNLVRHGRYEGLFDGLQLVYPPLLPGLVALVSALTPSLAAAGTIVALLSGVALISATYALAGRLYGRRTGAIAAALVAVHPTLIQLSGTVISEAIYLPLVVAGAHAAVVWLDERTRLPGLLCGTFFGLAYLTRPESLAAPLAIAIVFAACARIRGTTIIEALRQTLPMLAVTAVLAAPYVIYLSSQTGALHLEGKSVMNYTIARRIGAGMDPNEAALALGKNLEEEGPLLSPNHWIANAPPTIPTRGLADYWVENASRNFATLRWTLLSADFGGYPLLLLVALGLLVRTPARPLIPGEVLVLTLTAGYTFILLGQHMIAFRYVVPLLPFLLIWAAHGIGMITDWTVAGVGSVARHREAWRRPVAIAVPCVLALALVTPGVDLSRGGDFRSTAPHVALRKDAGIWLAGADPHRKTVMSTNTEVPYYAQATARSLPYAPEQRVLAYIRTSPPDYIVLTREPSTVGAYYTSWLQQGVPAPEARLVHRVGTPGDPDLAIYSWEPDPLNRTPRARRGVP